MTVVEKPTAGRGHSVVHRLRVGEIEPLTADSVAITFVVPPELADAYAFRAGQHVNIAMPDRPDERRSYSICTAVGSGLLRIAVKRIPGGVFSAHALTALRPGDELDVMTPAGRFGPEVEPRNARHYAAIAAGSGITPIMSIVSSVLQVEPESRVSVVYGNRSAASTMFLDELADLKDRYPGRVHLVHVLSREPQASELFSGRLEADRIAALLDTVLPADTVDEWYLCGPYEMVVGAREVLLGRGVESGHVHTELFHVGDPPVRPAEERRAAEVCEVTAVLDGRRSSITLDDPDESVLDAVLRARNDAPFACKGGVCGTCRAKVLHGAVSMERNFALEDDELEAGYVLTCQSHPTTPELSVDYDA